MDSIGLPYVKLWYNFRMATRNITFSIGEYYHVYNRGTDKRTIFLDEEDKDRFVKLLYIANSSNPFVFCELPIGLPYVEIDRGDVRVAIGAYVLMPNHFHILLKETTDGGIVKFMSKVLTSYSSYFNKKYKRTGRLFEGTFKAQHVDSDRYLKYLFAYIHLNPVKIIEPDWTKNGISNRAVAKDYLAEYIYSSYPEYIGVLRKEWKILNRTAFPEYFAEQQDFEEFVNEWLSFNKFP